MGFIHFPVLLNETLTALRVKPDGVYADGTAGGGGHSLAVAERLGESGRLVAIDRDPEAVAAARARLGEYPNAQVLLGNYSDIRQLLAGAGVDGADGILLDLGVSSHQLDTPERGFSYHGDAPLDMRMGGAGASAAEILAEYSASELADVFFKYGEEKFARKIAGNIIKAREVAPILTTGQLAQIVSDSVPYSVKRDKNPCKKTFQALRIEVNREFEHLERGLDEAFNLLNLGGRLVVITFHSLEDRIVKRKFADFTRGCTCPPKFPVCVCGKTPRARAVTNKPLVASQRELDSNIRSRSAKLRAVENLIAPQVL